MGIDVNEDASAAFKLIGNSGANFNIDGVPIGASLAADGTFVNLGATNVTITGILDVTAATVNGITGEVPVGGVIFFNAAFAGIPSNFQLCDGTNGTPNMTDQFVYGTNTEGELLDTGGSADAIVVQHSHGINQSAHDHNLSGGGSDDDGGPRPPGGDDGGSMNTAIASTTISISIQNAGVSGNNANIPPYIKLAFIQRMS